MFKENSKAIYLQIVDRICDEILAGSFAPGDRLPSVREYAATVQVNPNTMMRAYDYLSSKEIIYNKRGIGYFLAEKAPEIVTIIRRDELLNDRMNEIFHQLKLLGISPEELKSKYEAYLGKASDSDNQSLFGQK